MSLVLSAEAVGGKIVEWHSCIISKDIEQARILKIETTEMIRKMEPSDKMLSYYQLISFKYDLLLAYSENEIPENPDFNIVEKERDDYLNFMYYYVSGQNEFLNERYKSAIRTYKVAERLIEKVNDPAEKAEFYQELGISYYRISQYTFAASYMEQALEFFEKNSMYKINVITCKMVLAAINTEITHFDSAEIVYNEIIELSKPFPYTHALVLHNIGLNRMTQEKFEEAISLLERALSINEFANSIAAYKSRYNLLNAQLRLGTYSDGLIQLESDIKTHKLQELQAKCEISRGLYLEDDSSLIESGLNKLEYNELFFEYSGLCEEISQYFESKKDVETALKYARLSIEMNKKQTNLGVEQS